MIKKYTMQFMAFIIFFLIFNSMFAVNGDGREGVGAFSYFRDGTVEKMIDSNEEMEPCISQEESDEDLGEEVREKSDQKQMCEERGEGNEQEVKEETLDIETTDSEDLDEEAEMLDKEDSDSLTELEKNDSQGEKQVEKKEIKVSTQSGVAGVGLLTDTKLTVEHETNSEGKEIITLQYTGYGVLNLDLLSSTYSIFYLPTEIVEIIPTAKLTASYDVPVVGSIIRNRGDFEEIHLNGNQVYMNFRNLLSLNLLSRSFNFTLRMELDELPPTEDGEYVFYSQATNQLVDLSILSGEDVASATLLAPPVIDEPVYTTDTIVTGTGKANTHIILTINGTEYEGQVDGSGNFTVAIPEQEAGTVISAVLIDEAGNESEQTEVVVIEATLSFYSVPDAIHFEPAIIGSGTVTVPRKDPDWSIEVKDTRGEGSSWRMTAHADEPLTASECSHKLLNALVFVDGEGNSTPITKDPVDVFSGKTSSDRITTVHWEADQGPLIQVNAADVYAEEYRTSITWTLVDAP